MGKKDSSGRFTLLALSVTTFAMQPPGIITGLLLIEIAQTFTTTVGVMGQIRTASSMVSIIFALLMSGLSIRFNAKTLLVIGICVLGLSALGCGVATHYHVMIIMYALTGLGSVMVGPMANTLVAEHFLPRKRASATGWMQVAGAASYLLGAPIITAVASQYTWQYAFLSYALPILLLSGIAAQLLLPKGRDTRQFLRQPLQRNYSTAFREVFANTSAISCILGSVLVTATWSLRLTFGSTYLRQYFQVSTSHASIFIICSSFSYMLGSLASSRLVNKWGRKWVTVATAIPIGVLTIGYFHGLGLWFTLITGISVTTLSGILHSASTNLTLEQLPQYRSTMMSLNSAASSVGAAVGTGFGGWIILQSTYASAGIALGLVSIVAGVIYQLWVYDRIPISPATY